MCVFAANWAEFLAVNPLSTSTLHSPLVAFVSLATRLLADAPVLVLLLCDFRLQSVVRFRVATFLVRSLPPLMYVTVRRTLPGRRPLGGVQIKCAVELPVGVGQVYIMCIFASLGAGRVVTLRSRSALFAPKRTLAPLVFLGVKIVADVCGA